MKDKPQIYCILLIGKICTKEQQIKHVTGKFSKMKGKKENLQVARVIGGDIPSYRQIRWPIDIISEKEQGKGEGGQRRRSNSLGCHSTVTFFKSLGQMTAT